MNNRVEATYAASYTKRDVLVSRDNSANTVGVRVVFPFGPEVRGCRRVPRLIRILRIFHLDQW